MFDLDMGVQKTKITWKHRAISQYILRVQCNIYVQQKEQPEEIIISNCFVIIMKLPTHEPNLNQTLNYLHKQ